MTDMARNPAAPLTALLLFVSACCAFPITAAGEITPFTARYDFSHNGFRLAKMTRTLRRDGQHYVFESTSDTAGMLSAFLDDHIEERSRWDFSDGRPRPLHYEYHHTGRKDERHVELSFDWDKGVVTNTINRDPWQMEIPEGTQDKLLYQYTLMRDLQAGRERLEYEVADGGHLKTYRFERRGEEQIETPLGTLASVKLERIHGDRRTVIWCAGALDYMPVRIEQHKDGKTLRMVIREVEGVSLKSVRGEE